MKMVKQEMNKKKFHAYFTSSVLFGFLSILVKILFFNFINSLVNIVSFINNYRILVCYFINLFTFTLMNKKWNDLKRF